jgi:hypothetical protein
MVVLALTPAWALDESLQARIAIAPLTNESNDSSLDAVGHAVTDTIGLTLQLMGGYSLESPDGLQAVRSLETAKSLAASAKLDSLVLGSVNKDKQGALVLTVRLYDRQLGKYKIERSEKADSVLDVFDAADNLTKSFLEALSGGHVGFGSVELANAGEKADYEVRIDGASAGKSVPLVSKVLNGKHVVTVVQDRLFGPLELARIEAAIAEDETVKVSFSVPYLTDQEKARIDGLFSDAQKGLQSADLAACRAALDELDKIAASSTWSPRLKDQDILPKMAQLRRQADAMTARFDVENNPFAPDPSELSPLRPILASIGGDPANEPELRRLIAETADIEAVLLEYKAASAASKRDWAGVSAAYESMRESLDLCDASVADYYKDRISRYGRALQAYTKKAVPNTALQPFSPFMIQGGVAVAGVAAAIFAFGLDSQMATLAANQYTAYKAATTSSDAGTLHKYVDYSTAIANALAIGKWVGATVGLASAVIGTREAIVGTPEGVYRRYMESFFQASDAAKQRLSEALSRRPKEAAVVWADPSVALKVPASEAARKGMIVFANPDDYPGQAAPSGSRFFGAVAEPAWAAPKK